jgi:glycosyltransferase involved in cell wall biosynthesis
MAQTIKEILGDQVLRDKMSRMGLARSQQFSWKTAAKDMLAIFDELVTP